MGDRRPWGGQVYDSRRWTPRKRRRRSRASAAAVARRPRTPHGGPLALLRFLRARGMLTPKYGLLALRLAWLKLRWGKRLVTDGLAFVARG